MLDHDETPLLFDTLPPDEATVAMMSHSQVLDQILTINPTARWMLGETFDRVMLSNYLRHLIASRQPRGRESRWVRLADSPAILAREPRD